MYPNRLRHRLVYSTWRHPPVDSRLCLYSHGRPRPTAIDPSSVLSNPVYLARQIRPRWFRDTANKE